MKLTKPRIEVLLTPAEFETSSTRDISRSTCVVFDVLRASTSMIAALNAGARAILPVGTISEALALRRQDPEILLAGERHGMRITAKLAAGIEFDFGNSPREFVSERIRDRTLAMTTTNGTRALRAARPAHRVFVAAFLNLNAVVRQLRNDMPNDLRIICSGTYEEVALEDTLAAGALCHHLWSHYAQGHVADSAEIALQLYRAWSHDLRGAIQHCRNGRRLLAHPELKDDVAFALQLNRMDLVAMQAPDGRVTRCDNPDTP